MDHLDILGRNMPVEHLVDGDPQPMPDDIDRGLTSMALLISSKSWPADLKAAFDGMKKLVVFQGPIRVNRHLMDRSCCDEDDAVFYWKAAEFRQNTDADVRANTFFHDCWHVVQFKQKGGFAQGRADQIAREVDAIDRQIEAAGILGCDAREIGHLEDFRASQPKIEARLEDGVGVRSHRRNLGQRMFHSVDIPRGLA